MKTNMLLCMYYAMEENTFVQETAVILAYAIKLADSRIDRDSLCPGMYSNGYFPRFIHVCKKT